MKPRFLTELILRDVDGGTMQLHSPLRFISFVAGGVIEVPAGMQTDFASIPRIFWRIIPKNSRADFGAVVHDHLYQRNGVICLEEPKTWDTDNITYRRLPAGLSKRKCDLIFLEAMKSKGVPLWQRIVMYQAVNLFGGSAWNQHERENKGIVTDPCAGEYQ